jgi:hypothetical protein
LDANVSASARNVRSIFSAKATSPSSARTAPGKSTGGTLSHVSVSLSVSFSVALVSVEDVANARRNAAAVVAASKKPSPRRADASARRTPAIRLRASVPERGVAAVPDHAARLLCSLHEPRGLLERAHRRAVERHRLRSGAELDARGDETFGHLLVATTKSLSGLEVDADVVLLHKWVFLLCRCLIIRDRGRKHERIKLARRVPQRARAHGVGVRGDRARQQS